MPKFVDAVSVRAYHFCDRFDKNSHTAIIMPRGFSEREKDAIRTSLLNAGRIMLSTRGVHKTSVEDLTRAAHISKGAFYQFFPSKEALFLALFEEAELAYRRELCELARRPGTSAKARMVAFLHDALHLYRTAPLFSRLVPNDLTAVMRHLPPERLHDVMVDGTPFIDEFFTIWRESGVMLNCTPLEFAAITQAIFFMDVSSAPLGDARQSTLDFLIDAVADKLTR